MTDPIDPTGCDNPLCKNPRCTCDPCECSEADQCSCCIETPK